jgi:hypothetical protein
MKMHLEYLSNIFQDASSLRVVLMSPQFFFLVAYGLTLLGQKGTKLHDIHTQLSVAKLTVWYLQY